MLKTTYTITCLVLIWCTHLFGQNITPIAFDFLSPVDVNADDDGFLWTTEMGSGSNDGRILRVQADGTKALIIEGLPSFFNPMNNELQGALNTQRMSDGRIFVCQGGGPDTLSASILEFHWDDYVAKGSPLTPEDRRSTIKSGEWALANGFAETNPYSFVINGAGEFVISDAAANAIFKYDPATEAFDTLTIFPPFANPAPFGPPFVDVVPTKIIMHADSGYLVSSLTGFPFLDGASNIYHVQEDGTTSVYASGLTLITDLEIHPNDGSLLALQFAKFGQVDTTLSFIFGSAQLINIHEDGHLDTLAQGFGPSPGMTVTPDGTTYMTHLFLGQLLKADELLTDIFDGQVSKTQPLTVYPNPSYGNLELDLYIKQANKAHYVLMDALGKTSQYGSLGNLPAGENHLQFDFSEKIGKGIYYLHLFTTQEHFVSKVIIR